MNNTEANNQKKKPSKKIWTILFIVLNVAVVAYIAISEFSKKSGTDTAPRFSSLWPLYLACALGCLALLLLAETTKYAYMMHVLGQKVSWRAAFETAALGKYYDCITPSGVGGQPFQIYWLHKRGYSDGASSSMPVVGFISMQVGFLVLSGGVFIAWRSVELEPIRYAAYLGLLCYAFFPLVLIAFSIWPKAIGKVIGWGIRLGAKMHFVKDPDGAISKVMAQLENYQDSVKMLSGKKGSLVIIFLLSLVFHASMFSISYFVFMALGGSASFLHIFASTVYVYAAITIIVTPGNSGAAEGAFYLVFSTIGTQGVFWMMIIWRLLSYYSFIIIGGLTFLARFLNTRRMKRKKQYELKQQD